MAWLKAAFRPFPLASVMAGGAPPLPFPTHWGADFTTTQILVRGFQAGPSTDGENVWLSFFF